MKRPYVIALLVVIVAASWILYSQQPPETATLPEGITTAVVERASIESLVSATGSVAAEHEQPLSFGLAAQVVEVLAQQGDRVAKGQVLARLDDTDLQLNLRQAEAALAVAQAQLVQARLGSTSEELARYRAAVDSAQANADSADAAVERAQASLDLLLAGASEQEVAIAEHQIEEAKNALWSAQSQRDSICGRVKYGAPQADCDSANASVNQAEERVRIAELQLESLVQGARAQDVISARAAVSQANAQRDQARAMVAQAQADLARAERGPLAEQVAIAEAQVAQAEVGVDAAQARLTGAVLVAPAAGVLARWQVYPGDWAAPGVAVGTLVDDSRYHLSVAIDETDIHQVQVGQEARLQLDAYPDEQLLGHVAAIELLGDNSQGVVTYPVRIDLEPSDLAVRPLMTATVDIVAERKDQVLRVPRRAVRRDATSRYVQVVEKGALKRVNIEVGVTDAEYTEVLSGLQEGDVVVVTQPRESLLGVIEGQ
ncbi:MAG: efflux RND transporter periplasmic adaptor subunit [Anaerolineales bacterium]